LVKSAIPSCQPVPHTVASILDIVDSRFRVELNNPAEAGQNRRAPDEGSVGRPATFSLYQGDSFAWLSSAPRCSVHAVVTDPPYGLLEYSDSQLLKLRAGEGACGEFRRPSTAASDGRSPASRY